MRYPVVMLLLLGCGEAPSELPAEGPDLPEIQDTAPPDAESPQPDPLPNLRVSGLVVTPGPAVTWGQTVGYEVTLDNNGVADAAEYTWTTRRCDADGDCIGVAEETVFSHPAGQAIGSVRSLIVPDDTVDGTYCLQVALDTGFAIDETDEADNVLAPDDACFTVKYQPEVDLVVSEFACPEAGTHGAPLAATATVTNQGGLASGEWAYQIYVSSSPVIAPATSWPLCWDGCDALPSLEGGASVELAPALQVPADVPQGPRFCVLVIDAALTVVESDDDNNSAVSAIEISAQ